MVFGYLLLYMLSLKKPNIAKVFIYYECLFNIVTVTLPVDFYDTYASELFYKTQTFIQGLSFNYLPSLFPILIMWIYKDLAVPRLIYEQEITREVMRICVFDLLLMTIFFTFTYLLICWIGHLYVKAEV